MLPMSPDVACQKSDPKRTAKLALGLVLAACTLWLEGCSAVLPNASASSSSTKTQSSRITLPGATVGTTYRQQLINEGEQAPVGYVTEAQLPPGLSFNPQSGTLSGVPSQSGTFTFTITLIGEPRGATLTNPTLTNTTFTNTTITNTYTVSVASGTNEVSLQISPAEPSVAAGASVQFAATVKNTSNTAVLWSASAGSISGSGLWTAPSGTSLKSVTVTATSAANGSVHSSATATITSGLFSIGTTTLPSGSTGTAYSAALTASGGQLPYQWSVLSGLLPTGLQLNSSTGILAGTPSTAGTYTFTVQGLDGDSQTAQHSYSIMISNSGASCGPPTYPCSRTDEEIVQLPATLPNIGNLIGANNIVTDPNFGNPIVRITDSNTNPAPGFADRTFVTATSGSADENLWNLDSTLFVVQDTGARAYPFTFNPSTMQASRMYVSSYPSTNGLTLSDTGTWSHVSPNLLYVATGTSITKYDFTDRNTAPSAQAVYDFTSSRNCLPKGFTQTWQTRGGLSADDTVFGMGYSDAGGQGTGIYVVAYKVGSGCTMLNTQTGQVSGDWGVKGTINTPDRWLVHNVKLSKDGNWMVIAREHCTTSNCAKQPYFWQIGTTNISSCGDGRSCGGHWTEGYSHWVNNNNAPMSSQVIRSFADSSVVSDLSRVFPSNITHFDEHQSWNNVDPADSVPFASTTWSPLTTFPAPWYNEIIAIASDGSGTTWRFAHSFNSGVSQQFSTQYAIGSISQDGNFFIFSSDWMGRLGSESGASTCTIGTNCRGDVFVVALR